MQEKELLRVSFLVSTIGLIILYVFNPQPLVIKISEVKDNLDRRVIITGEIESLKFHENGHVFIKVRDETGEIKVVIFKNVARKLGEELACIKLNRSLIIEGKAEEYRGEAEIIAEEIKCTT